MQTRYIRALVGEYKKNRSLKTTSYDSFCDSIEEEGYTVVEFSPSSNEIDVEMLIDALGVANQIKTQRGFTYADNHYRVIFINENLSNEEKKIVLAHEIGHIMCGHMSVSSIIGKDVKEEYEANEFAHFLLKEKTPTHLLIAAGCMGVVIAVILILFLFS